MGYPVYGEKSTNERKWNKIHAEERKFSKASDASEGRVMKERPETISSASMSRPSGRTSFAAGFKTASTNAT